jgi:phage-related tail fiber protein
LDLGVLGKTMISMYAQTDNGDPPVYTPKLSFFGAAPVIKPAPTASGTGNVLGSIVSSLNSLGLINSSGISNAGTLAAAGSNTQVQYNSSGTFGASSSFTYNSGTNTLTVGNVTASLTGNANTATTLQTSRTISATGDATWSVNFDGSANTTAALTLATVATAGTYKSVTVDVKGRVTAGTNPTTLAGYGITDAVSNTGNSLPVTYGNISSAQLITSTTTANQVVDSFSATTYRTVKYLVQATSSTSYQSSEIMIVHNGTTAFISEYGTVMTGTSLASFDADVSGGNVRLLVTPTNAVTTINVVRTAIVV